VASSPQLLLRVADVMLTQTADVDPDRPMRECVMLLAEKRGTGRRGGAGRRATLAGVVTAGDLTRLMERTTNSWTSPSAMS